MADDAYDPLYLKGIEYFNNCDFFEAHEAWEELWTEYSGPARKFYQGLIQVAVALHHFGNGNIRGATQAVRQQPQLSAAVPAVLHWAGSGQAVWRNGALFRRSLASTEEFPTIDLYPETIPEIHLDPPASG